MVGMEVVIKRERHGLLDDEEAVGRQVLPGADKQHRPCRMHLPQHCHLGLKLLDRLLLLTAIQPTERRHTQRAVRLR